MDIKGKLNFCQSTSSGNKLNFYKFFFYYYDVLTMLIAREKIHSEDPLYTEDIYSLTKSDLHICVI